MTTVADDLVTYAYPGQPPMTDQAGFVGEHCPASTGPWWCSRKPGHGGQHEAGNGFGRVLAAWGGTAPLRAFPGWRAAGLAMVWARRQGAVVKRKALELDPGNLTDHSWSLNHAALTVSGMSWREPTEVVIDAGAVHIEMDSADVATVLRLLAALNLIPAELAEPSERYGRCVTCGQLCRWDEGHDLWTPRWLHCDPVEVWATSTQHLAEVAE